MNRLDALNALSELRDYIRENDVPITGPVRDMFNGIAAHLGSLAGEQGVWCQASCIQCGQIAGAVIHREPCQLDKKPWEHHTFQSE